MPTAFESRGWRALAFPAATWPRRKQDHRSFTDIGTHSTDHAVTSWRCRCSLEVRSCDLLVHESWKEHDCRVSKT